MKKEIVEEAKKLQKAYKDIKAQEKKLGNSLFKDIERCRKKRDIQGLHDILEILPPYYPGCRIIYEIIIKIEDGTIKDWE